MRIPRVVPVSRITDRRHRRCRTHSRPWYTFGRFAVVSHKSRSDSPAGCAYSRRGPSKTSFHRLRIQNTAHAAGTSADDHTGPAFWDGQFAWQNNGSTGLCSSCKAPHRPVKFHASYWFRASEDPCEQSVVCENCPMHGKSCNRTTSGNCPVFCRSVRIGDFPAEFSRNQRCF